MKKIVLLLFVFGLIGLSACSKKDDPKPEPKIETVSLEIENLTLVSKTDTKVVLSMPADMVELKTQKTGN